MTSKPLGSETQEEWDRRLAEAYDYLNRTWVDGWAQNKLRPFLSKAIDRWTMVIPFYNRCQCCNTPFGVYTKRQNTDYVDDASNWATLCKACHDMNDQHWEGLWHEYYSSRL